MKSFKDFLKMFSSKNISDKLISEYKKYGNTIHLEDSEDTITNNVPFPYVMFFFSPKTLKGCDIYLHKKKNRIIISGGSIENVKIENIQYAPVMHIELKKCKISKTKIDYDSRRFTITSCRLGEKNKIYYTTINDTTIDDGDYFGCRIGDSIINNGKFVHCNITGKSKIKDGSFSRCNIDRDIELSKGTFNNNRRVKGK